MPITYETLSQGGHEAMATEIFAKIKSYLDTHGADSKVSKSGDTMTGSLNMQGVDINLNTPSSSSNDSGDIVFYYGNGQEKTRLWTNTDYTAATGINYRVYKSDGTSLYSGTLATLGQVTSYFSSMSTENTTDTWIPVWKSGYFQHCFREIWTSVTHTNHATGKDRLVTKSVLSFWNGAYNSSGNSNLQYCDRGRFGTIITKNSGDYLPYGATQKAASGSGKTVTAGTILNCCSIAITAGTWIVTYSANFPSGATNKSTCGCLVSTASNSNSPVCHGALVNAYYTNVNENRNGNAFIYQASGNVTLYLNLWARGSGTIASCGGEIRAFRVG